MRCSWQPMQERTSNTRTEPSSSSRAAAAAEQSRGTDGGGGDAGGGQQQGRRGDDVEEFAGKCVIDRTECARTVVGLRSAWCYRARRRDGVELGPAPALLFTDDCDRDLRRLLQGLPSLWARPRSTADRVASEKRVVRRRTLRQAVRGRLAHGTAGATRACVRGGTGYEPAAEAIPQAAHIAMQAAAIGVGDGMGDLISVMVRRELMRAPCSQADPGAAHREEPAGVQDEDFRRRARRERRRRRAIRRMKEDYKKKPRIAAPKSRSRILNSSPCGRHLVPVEIGHLPLLGSGRCPDGPEKRNTAAGWNRSSGAGPRVRRCSASNAASPGCCRQ